jgi:glyoxylase-like metal-dependent hydrolase (beta-lactamase superfamily II)
MQQILPNVYLLEGVRGANVYLLASEAGLTLIDSGNPGGTKNIVDQIEAQYILSDLHAIVVTHAHSDHTGCVADLARRSGARVLAHRDDVAYCGRTATLPYKNVIQQLLFGLTERVIFRFEPFKVDRPLQDGDVVETLGGLQVVHVPGHTPGSIALYQPERKILFCGDIFFHINPRKGLTVSPFIVSTDPAQARKSAQRLAGLETNFLCVSHGAPILDGAQEEMLKALEAVS